MTSPYDGTMRYGYTVVEVGLKWKLSLRNGLIDGLIMMGKVPVKYIEHLVDIIMLKRILHLGDQLRKRRLVSVKDTCRERVDRQEIDEFILLATFFYC